MKDEEEIFFEREDKALSEPGHRFELPALDVSQRGFDRPKDERAREADLPQHLTPHEAVEVLEVNGHVRQLGHSRENIGR